MLVRIDIVISYLASVRCSCPSYEIVKHDVFSKSNKWILMIHLMTECFLMQIWILLLTSLKVIDRVSMRSTTYFLSWTNTMLEHDSNVIERRLIRSRIITCFIYLCRKRERKKWRNKQRKRHEYKKEGEKEGVQLYGFLLGRKSIF